MKLSQEVRHHFFSETRVYIAFRIVFSCCQFQFLEFSSSSSRSVLDYIMSAVAYTAPGNEARIGIRKSTAATEDGMPSIC